ncbi:MAG: PilN domain-containing protein [Gaiellaceae bacterium]
MRAVNLLPSEAAGRAPRSAPQPAVLAAAISGVVAVVAIGGGNLLETARVSSAQKTLNAAKIQLAATPLPPAAPKVAPPPVAVAEQMQPRLDAVSSALSSRIAWDRILREFSLVLPSDVQLTALSLNLPTAGHSGAGLNLTGVTYSYDSVARLLARMALIPDLTGVTLGPTALQEKLVQFTITANVKGAVSTAPPTVAPAATTTTTAGA